jgi:CDP-diglyceride synthetase
VLFGAMLLVAAYLTQRFDIKKHFKFSYHHYGVHVAFISLLAGYFEYYDSSYYILWMVVFFALAVYIYIDAYKEKSFYFILLAILYSYFAIACILIRMLYAVMQYDAIYLLLLSFIASAIGLIFLLININKKLKAE